MRIAPLSTPDTAAIMTAPAPTTAPLTTAPNRLLRRRGAVGQARGRRGIPGTVGLAAGRQHPPCGDGHREGDQLLGVVEVDIEQVRDLVESVVQGLPPHMETFGGLRLVAPARGKHVQGVRKLAASCGIRLLQDSDLIVDELSRGVQVAVRVRVARASDMARGRSDGSRTARPTVAHSLACCGKASRAAIRTTCARFGDA